MENNQCKKYILEYLKCTKHKPWQYCEQIFFEKCIYINGQLYLRKLENET